MGDHVHRIAELLETMSNRRFETRSFEFWTTERLGKDDRLKKFHAFIRATCQFHFKCTAVSSPNNSELRNSGLSIH